MKTWMFIIYLLTSCSFVSFAQAPKPFLLTHIVYPDTDDYSKLFVEIYTELGFKVELIPTPSLRGLILLNNDVVDADVLRLGLIAKTYPNVIVVQPKLQSATLSLICSKGVPCDRSILRNEKISILANSRMLALLEDGEFKSVHVENELFSSVLEMLKAGRYNYAIYVIDDVIEKQFDQDLQVVELKKISINHVIHKKHIGLLPQIQEKIRSKLPELTRRRLENSHSK
ncbi:hypothetical protein [Paraglaciecola psychrophila]|uniref:Solute-binding protein family 3/N-terminal domain-containing protein n=1 Tax=Paraglaciecola psychrophila 170 TaxID=1129794 RepID=K7A557_9ALTE|nr:hypothetical protein [Paraglaciecola psychrophila]AGH46851.1 hypothetical protein C427_4752 [Paraglaciecola psychrophila 170]GAC35983.1 hypothetical protein GPSY_0341 [Paraglaciecola psychrophila 170]